MAQYLDYEGLELYDKNIKDVISIKNVSDYSKVKVDKYPENSIIKYTGTEVLENKIKLSAGNYTFIVNSSNITTLANVGQLTAEAEDGIIYTIYYNQNDTVNICPGPLYDATRLVALNTPVTKENITKPKLVSQQYYKVSYVGSSTIFTPIEIGVDVGAISLDYDVTSNIGVGAISAGDTIKKGTDFSDFVRKLLTKEIAPSIKVSLTTAEGFHLKSTEGITLSKAQATIIKNSAAAIDSVKFILPDNTEIPMTKQNDVWVCMPNITYTENVKFKVIVTYKKSDNKTMGSTSIETYYKFIDPIILGIGKTRIYDSLDLNNTLPTSYELKVMEAKGELIYPVNTNNSEVVICLPGKNKFPISIKDKNGFEYIDIFKNNSIDIKVTNLANEEIDYTMMWSKTATLVGSFAYIITF